MNKDRIAWLTGIILIPIIIYFYFLKWSNTPFHDDDLFILKDYSGLKTFWERLNVPLYGANQYRPVFGLMIHFAISLFQRNLLYYYLFNVGIQTLNTILFAQILNLFFKSVSDSLLFSLLLGLSRFTFYNLYQDLSGGILEGVATLFFLLFLFSILKVFINRETRDSQKNKGIILSILFANLSMYTHERYVVLLPFIIFIILFYPDRKILSLKQKIIFSAITFITLLLPFIIKKYIYSIPIFMGTGFTTIAFSPKSSIGLFFNAILSLFQINEGPAYLSGIEYANLPSPAKYLSLFVAFFTSGIFVFYLLKSAELYFLKQERSPSFFIFIFLAFLFIFLLIPGIVQIRFELRWLQASLCVLVLMLVIAFGSMRIGNMFVRKIVLMVFAFSFLLSDYNYLSMGVQNLYFSLSGRVTQVFYSAIANGTIHSNADKLYIYEKQRNPDRENEINWALARGYFFKFYTGRNIELNYFDSFALQKNSSLRNAIFSINKKTDQILNMTIRNYGESFDYTLTDITAQFLKDSLKNYKD